LLEFDLRAIASVVLQPDWLGIEFPEWLGADFAVMAAGLVIAGLAPATTMPV
jgi:hypothetical protein